MQDEGITPTLPHYNSLFKALEYAERWREAANLFKKLRADGLRPNALTYGPLIGVLDKCKKKKIVRNFGVGVGGGRLAVKGS